MQSSSSSPPYIHTVALGNDHMTLLIFNKVRLASYKPIIVALLLRKYNLLIRQLLYLII
jgi:hypothetical protein